MDTVCGKWRVF